jgi:hypothetical protein
MNPRKPPIDATAYIRGSQAPTLSSSTRGRCPHGCGSGTTDLAEFELAQPRPSRGCLGKGETLPSAGADPHSGWREWGGHELAGHVAPAETRFVPSRLSSSSRAEPLLSFRADRLLSFRAGGEESQCIEALRSLASSCRSEPAHSLSCRADRLLSFRAGGEESQCIEALRSLASLGMTEGVGANALGMTGGGWRGLARDDGGG